MPGGADSTKECQGRRGSWTCWILIGEVRCVEMIVAFRRVLTPLDYHIVDLDILRDIVICSDSPNGDKVAVNLTDMPVYQHLSLVQHTLHNTRREGRLWVWGKRQGDSRRLQCDLASS